MHGPGDREAHAASAPASAAPPAATSGRTARRSSSPRSHDDPDAKKHQEAEIKQRAEDAKKGVRRRYSWDFDPHMKIYEANLDGSEIKCLTPNAKVYTAEGSYSADGKKIVYQLRHRGRTCNCSS